MKKLSIGLFIAHLCITILLTSLNKYSFGIADAIVSIALLGFNCYQSYLEAQELPDIRQELNTALEIRDKQIQTIKNDMAKVNVLKVANTESSSFRF